MDIENYFPACFNSKKQYREWKLLSMKSCTHRYVSFCEDCTLDYQAKMVNERRCEQFDLDLVAFQDKHKRSDISRDVKGKSSIKDIPLGDDWETMTSFLTKKQSK
jgi:hypothetical protein